MSRADKAGLAFPDEGVVLGAIGDFNEVNEMGEKEQRCV